MKTFVLACFLMLYGFAIVGSVLKYQDPEKYVKVPTLGATIFNIIFAALLACGVIYLAVS